MLNSECSLLLLFVAVCCNLAKKKKPTMVLVFLGVARLLSSSLGTNRREDKRFYLLSLF